jgi:hypothetical protein
MSFFSDILGAITSGLLPEELTTLFETELPQVTAPDITFKPFTVTGAQGGKVNTLDDGSTTYNLSPVQKAMQQQLFTGSSNFFTNASLGTADREADIYERMRAVQRPEELRKQQAMQEQMFAQGRGGVRTAQYGGTPEQLAMYKAQAEAQNSAMLGAMQQAQQEQTQQATLGNQYLQSSYAPQAALLSAMSPALNVAGMADVAHRQQGEYNLEAQLANMQGKLGQQTGMANLYGGVYGGLLGGLGSIISGSGKDGKPWWLDF